MSAPVLAVHGVSKRFVIRKDKSLKERLVNSRRGREHAEEFWALRDVSFELQTAGTLGLIGRNGSGKSTLLKVIGGILRPDEGTVARRGRLAALLELGAGFHPDLTGRENVYLNASILGLSRRETDSYFDAIVDFSGIEEFLDTQVKFYSSGMYVRLAFAVAVHVDPEILLVDEVLSVGDEPFQRKCLDRIRRFQREGRTIVLVTHGLDTVREMCDHAVLLEHGHVIESASPLQAIRAFRERYTDTEASTSDLSEGEVDGGVRVGDVVLRRPDGSLLTHIAPRDAGQLELTVTTDAPLEEWSVGISIEDHLDTLVYHTSDRHLGVDIGPLPVGQTRVRFSFDQLPLPEGHYYFTIDVADALRRRVYRRAERVAHMRVSSPLQQEGKVFLAPQLDVERLTAPSIAAAALPR